MAAKVLVLTELTLPTSPASLTVVLWRWMSSSTFALGVACSSCAILMVAVDLISTMVGDLVVPVRGPARRSNAALDDDESVYLYGQLTRSARSGAK